MRIFLILCLFISTNIFSQSDILAREYFKNGDFKKALAEYKKIYEGPSTSLTNINAIVETHQQLEQYAEAEAFLLEVMEDIAYSGFLVDLGYNFQLQKDTVNARLQYNKALESIDLRASNVFSVAKGFQNHSLLDEAILAYEKGVALNPKYNFDLQLAQLYGEQGKVEKMFTSYIDYVEANPFTVNNIKRSINDFISENSDNENNIIFRKILLKKAQQTPDLLWNELLSWLFVQQKDIKKAFVQEKAIFNRQPESLNRIADLAVIATNEKAYETAKEIYTYLIEKAQDTGTKVSANYHLLQLEEKVSSKENYEAIEAKYLELFEEFGSVSQTLKLQIAYAHFLAFYKNETTKATSFLEKSLKLSLTEFQKAEVKLELGDILVLQEKFNQALIYYTQIQRSLKNSEISQEARYKVAKTSYYKGDFKWAESQLKILKASTSQLIANDALDLKLLITDNKYEDSLQTALKLYAKADLLAFQNRNDEAISLLSEVLAAHKTEPIIAQALYKQAELFEGKQQFEKAESNYKSIIENYGEGILIDNALFKLAELYMNYLEQPDKAKPLYEQIIFSHPDSIYFVEARKKFRALRGDAIN
ncbi:tetratricopeptide repeat protein [Algibacter lectus]|uniref:Secreted protein containing tetratricopeptide repeats n=1 Tax=Algibacter lectus TaxID=221126 RepID=A0A090V780_9FLAO|nr:tetratricopeptide repeat protein [Algibacter lectus]GAL60681.1 secreted protein containing tetratricopeptide repeats [Algibacter lectus]